MPRLLRWRRAGGVTRRALAASQEVRFLFPALPLFNAVAAAALARLYQNRRARTARICQPVPAER